MNEMLAAEHVDRLPPFRSLNFKAPKLEVRHHADGSIILRHAEALDEPAATLIHLLRRWSRERPDRTFIAERDGAGAWRRLTYAEARHQADAIGQMLLDRGLVAGDTVMILSGNSVEHAAFLLGAMTVGVIAAPTSPQYALIPQGHAKLQSIAERLKPAVVFVQDARLFAPAVQAIACMDRVVAVHNVDAVPGAASFADAIATEAGPAVEEAFAALTPETTAKILFTSGSTGWPKGVINTHGMMCANLAQSRMMYKEAPTEGEDILCWLPWNHTMAGNGMFNGTLGNGGSYYIDDGRPTSPHEFAKTVRNLREVKVTKYGDVPIGLSFLADVLERDPEFSKELFGRLHAITYAAATLPDEMCRRLQRLSSDATGERIPILSGYGSTETAPGLLLHCWAAEGSGYAGLPYPGIDIKLLPLGDGRYEIRARGPNITPGYYGQPEMTATAFDEEGYFRMGDAVSFVNDEDPLQGLRFAGRLAEDFKLLTGTFVSAGNVRAALVSALSPFLSDALIVGEGRASLGALVWLNVPQARALLGSDAADAGVDELARAPALRAELGRLLAQYNAVNRGSSLRIERLRVLRTPPSVSANEITDKGYINRAVSVAVRADDIAAMHAEDDGMTILPAA